MKRFVSAILAGLMILSMAGCGNTGQKASTTNSNSTSTTKEATTEGEAPTGLPVLSPDNPVNFSVYLPSDALAPTADNKILKLIKDELGVTFSFDIVPQGNQEQKIGVLIAGGEYPDFIGAVDLNVRFAEAGALEPLDDYMTPELAANIMEHVGPYHNKMSYVKDGKVYILPGYGRFYGEITGGTHYGAAFWLQKAVLAEFGYPEVTTLDQYFDLIAKYMEKYPTIDGQPTVGFESLATGGKEFVLMNPPEHLSGHLNDGMVVVDDLVAQIFTDKPMSYDWYKYLNDMNSKGLVDRQSFTQTFDQYLSKLASGRVLGMFDQRWSFGNAYDALMAEGKDERTWAPVMLTYEGYEPWYRERPGMNVNQGLGVSATSPKKLEAISFLNTILEEKWQKTFSWGIEGEDYMVDESGKFYRTEQQRADSQDLVWKAKNRIDAFFGLLPKTEGTFPDGNAFAPDGQPEEFFATLHEYDQNFMKAYNKETWLDFTNDPPENPIYFPAWNIALEDGSDAQVAGVQLNESSLQYLPKLILADPADFDKIWEEYTTAIGKINVKAYEEAVNAGIQKRVAEWGE